jgi:hypothetical protein
MPTKSVRISDYSLNEVRKISEQIGDPTDDTALRFVISEYYRLKAENEFYKEVLRGCTVVKK